MNCSCKCNCSKKVRVRLKNYGSDWRDSLSYDPADAARREIEYLFEKGRINIANGNVIAVETEQEGKKKTFIVERNDVTMFHSKEV